MMKNITVRMTEELHRELKMNMLVNGKTIQDHVVELIEEYLSKNKIK